MPIRKDLNVYVWQDVPNWGDQLGLYLIQYYVSHKYETHAVDDIKKADIIGLGSTLHHIPEGWKGIIAGTGRISNEKPVGLLPSPIILGVRGYYSLDRPIIGLENGVFGDPGLITSRIITGSFQEPADIGIIPHWSDTALKYDSRFYGPWTTKFINPFRTIWEVIWDIMVCKKIVTSSLHGAVIADAYGIPRRIVPARSMLANPHEGGMFKFKDYMSALDMPYVPEVLDRPDQDRVTQVQDDILAMYKSLPDILDANYTNIHNSNS